MTFFYYLLLGVFFLNCLFLSLLVLVQKSRSMGLGASFGGDAGTSLFGTSTNDVLKKLTSGCGVVFAILCFVLSVMTSVQELKASSTSMINQEHVEK